MSLMSLSQSRVFCCLVLALVVVLSFHVYVHHSNAPQQLHRQQPSVSPGTLKTSKNGDSKTVLFNFKLVQLALELNARYGVVLFTMLNDAFLDFAHSWLCNTRSFRDLHQRIVFLTTDLPTARVLKSTWPETTAAVLSRSELSGAMNFSTVSYVRLMLERTHIIHELLKVGVTLLLFEVDAVWMKDPMPEVLSLQTKADIVATKVTDKDLTAGGFLLLNPNPATLLFWQELTHLMDQLYSRIKSMPRSAVISRSENDQGLFSRLARTKFAGVKIAYLPAASFPDGKWYSLPEQQRRESRPLLINNNWIVGTKAKRQRAKSFGHWFWEESQLKCNFSALRDLGL